MHQPRLRYTSSTEVLDFISRTEARGVPLRVAVTRASRRYGIARDLVVALVRGGRTAP